MMHGQQNIKFVKQLRLAATPARKLTFRVAHKPTKFTEKCVGDAVADVREHRKNSDTVHEL
jgi:hypothetical protein